MIEQIQIADRTRVVKGDRVHPQPRNLQGIARGATGRVVEVRPGAFAGRTVLVVEWIGGRMVPVYGSGRTVKALLYYPYGRLAMLPHELATDPDYEYGAPRR